MSGASSINKLLGVMKGLGASDLHLKAGMPPYYRVGGHLRSANMPAVSGKQIEELVSPIVPEGRLAFYEEFGDLDFSCDVVEGERFRVNIFRAGNHLNAAIRRVNAEIPSYEDLHLPPIYGQLVDKAREGIIVISGVTGSGKSTTIAAMLEHINETRRENIVTIEDPIEYLFRPNKSIISQREIGIDIPTYGEGLKYIVRQDPDVIFIGEMRDKFTMTAALQAAETGHLVFGSLHTADAMQAFARILEFFPRSEHEFIRGSLSNALRAICAQRLLPGCQEKYPLVPATEVLLNTPTCRELIRKELDEDIPALIASSEKEGMHSFTSSLAKLVDEELVFRDTAMKYAPNPDALASQMRGITTQAQGLVSRVRGGGT
jgi:twitching motility protein PilT